VLHGQHIDAEVVELREIKRMIAPIISFRFVDNTAREVQETATATPKRAVGDRVKLYYDPDDPDDFRVDDFDSLWFSAVFMVCFGCFWLLFGVVAWAVSRDVDMFVVGERAFGAIAVAAAVIGGIATWDAGSLLMRGLRTEGEVIDVRVDRTKETEEIERGGTRFNREVERISYAPIVRFVASDGRQVEFAACAGSETGYSVGDKVRVLYLPATPAAARLLTFLDLWLPAAVAWGVAVVFGGVVWLSRWMRRRYAS
jgi:hypothetical protein